MANISSADRKMTLMGNWAQENLDVFISLIERLKVIPEMCATNRIITFIMNVFWSMESYRRRVIL